MSDLRDLIGDDVDPEELNRLQRVHTLLEQAGPPPSLSPSLARPRRQCCSPWDTWSETPGLARSSRSR